METISTKNMFRFEEAVVSTEVLERVRQKRKEENEEREAQILLRDADAIQDQIDVVLNDMRNYRRLMRKLQKELKKYQNCDTMRDIVKALRKHGRHVYLSGNY